ncbi:MAG: DUF4870 domain-containing protein [Chloroflexota bacterium]
MTDNDNNLPQNNTDEDRLSRLMRDTTLPDEDPLDDATIVEEYERRYRPHTHPQRKAKPRSYSTLRVSDEDKLWSAVAHGSVWITFLMAVPTSGISLPFVVFIPLIIYFVFRNRSDYVAFHALQAFVMQLICTVGALAGFIIGGIAWAIILVIFAVLSVVLIGIPLMIIWVIVGMLASLIFSVLPLVGLVFATIAGVRVYTGADFRYPFIADWVDRQMAGGLLNA